MTDLTNISTDDLLSELGRRAKGGPASTTEAAPVPGGVGAPLRIAYLGNFDPPHSTENEYAKAWQAAGHAVTTFQESNMDVFGWVAGRCSIPEQRPDIIMWTRTVWPRMDFDAMRQMLHVARQCNVPVIGVHLDIWWGLARQEEIGRHPWFDCDVLFTADGGHPDEWALVGIEHEWLPPGVSEFECIPADPAPEYAADVAFVGGWQPGYHAESWHRAQLIDHLRKRGDVRFFPPKGQHAIRGENLRKLYATTKVNVGDSCFAGTGLARYWSDRIPETLGRGGFLLHPYVPGIEEHFTDLQHLRLYEPGNWKQLDELIDQYLHEASGREMIAEWGQDHVLGNHTYTVRVAQIVERLRARGMLT